MMLLKRLEWDFWFGLKSNIPLCCIIFFLIRNIIHTYFNDDMATGAWLVYIQSPIQKLIKPKIEYDYIHCPICLILGKSKKIKECGPDYKYPKIKYK